MKESLYTIPVTETFEEKKGCPICALYATLEKNALEYIMGAAMMEPSVRIATNKVGFCYEHLQRMRKMNNRLALALMFESRMAQMQRDMESLKYKDNKTIHSCFVCEKIEKEHVGMIDTVYHLYNTQAEFRDLYSNQECLCYTHYTHLRDNAKKKIGKKLYKEFCDKSFDLANNQLEIIKKDVRHYCDMFDYTNSSKDADWGNSKDSIERAIWWTTSKKIIE